MRRRGLSLLEVLVVLGVLGVLVGLAGVRLGRSAAARAAYVVDAELRAARVAAIARGVPMAAVVDEELARLEVKAGAAGDDPTRVCDAGEVTSAVDMRTFAPARWERGLERGVVWLPYGAARSCSGGGVISTRVVLRGLRGAHSVVISSAGRIRREAMP